MSISVTNTKSPITVVDDKVTIKVTGGFGPQGPAGSSESGGGAIASINGQTGTITISYAGGVTAAGGTITLGYVSPPVTSVAGRTGAVTLSTGDVSGLGSLATKSSLGNITSAGAVGTVAERVLVTDAGGAIVALDRGPGLVIEDDQLTADVPYIKTQLADVASSGSYTDLTNKPTIPVTSVAGRTGAVTLTTSDVSGYTAPPVTSVAGRTGAVTLTTSDVSGFAAAASSAAPVQSVAGRTGAVTLSTADVSGYAAPPVTSVAGRTGAVTLSSADVSGLPAVATSGAYADLSGKPTTLAGYGITDAAPARSRRFAWSSPYSYSGRAAAGSSTSASVWTIKRSQVSAAGAITATLTATNVAWDDYATASYS